jgi:hypothetical protein
MIGMGTSAPMSCSRPGPAGDFTPVIVAAWRVRTRPGYSIEGRPAVAGRGGI